MKPTCFLLCGLFLALDCESARADGGALQASEQSGRYRISIFTNPTPLRVGPADISVLIQDTSNADATAKLPTKVTITPAEIEAIATTAAATNKLFVAANVNLPIAGKQQIEVICSDGDRKHRVRFTTTVEPPLPHWQNLWPWFSWPIAVAVIWLWLRRSKTVTR